MEVTKQHKILGIVLLVGGMALASDRLFFLKSSGSEAAAEPASTYAVAAPVKSAGAITPAQPSAASVSVAQKLRNAAESVDTNAKRDAFGFGAAWSTPAAAAAKVPETNNSAEQFRQSHRLTGALTSGAAAHAMIDGKIVSVGESIDGYRLVSISHRSVTFEPAEGEPVVLNMNERAGANSTVSASAVP